MTNFLSIESLSGTEEYQDWFFDIHGSKEEISGALFALAEVNKDLRLMILDVARMIAQSENNTEAAELLGNIFVDTLDSKILKEETTVRINIDQNKDS